LKPLSEQEISNRLLQQLESARSNNTSPFIVEGKNVCRQAFLQLTGISGGKWDRISAIQQSGGSFVASAGAVGAIVKSSPMTEMVVTQLSVVFTELCIASPNATSKAVPVRTLPHYFRIRDIQELLRDRMCSDSSPAPSNSLICRVWNKWFPDVVRPRNTDFGNCADCHQLTTLQRMVKTLEETKEVKQLRAAHQDAFEAQRRYGEQQIAQAKSQPKSVTYAQHDYTMPIALPSYRPKISVSSSFSKPISYNC
jgi:hypothetical protein